MSEDTPAKFQDKYILRLPDGMREYLKEAAKKNKRSLNAEIVDRLQRTMVVDEIVDEKRSITPDKKYRLSLKEALRQASLLQEVLQYLDEHGTIELIPENIVRKIPAK
jgi:hypothetical protein